MENKTINIGVVKKIAVALKEMRKKVAFVGGAVISLYTDDPAADELRPTKDIDLVLLWRAMGRGQRFKKNWQAWDFLPTIHLTCFVDLRMRM